MPTCKIAAWNIFYSWTLVGTHQGALRIPTKQVRRAANVGRIINELDADILGIVECMSKRELAYFRNQKCPQYNGLLLNVDKAQFTLGLCSTKQYGSKRKISVKAFPSVWIGNVSSSLS